MQADFSHEDFRLKQLAGNSFLFIQAASFHQHLSDLQIEMFQYFSNFFIDFKKRVP